MLLVLSSQRAAWCRAIGGCNQALPQAPSAEVCALPRTCSCLSTGTGEECGASLHRLCAARQPLWRSWLQNRGCRFGFRSSRQLQLAVRDLTEGEQTSGFNQPLCSRELFLLQIQCKLFVFDKSSQSWVERGRGLLRLNDMASTDDGTLQSRLGKGSQGQ